MEIRYDLEIEIPIERNRAVTSPMPFLRWAGGKRQSLPLIHAALPRALSLKTNRFYEPFVGGGAVMFSLSEIFQARDVSNRAIVINDVNEDLIATYRALRDEPEKVVKGLRRLENRTAESDYYEIRSQVPKSSVERAVRLIYLNRTGFNGLYRVNSSGDFNVPWGKLKNPTICNEPLLRAVGSWLSHIDIRLGPFSTAVTDAKAGDVVYFDPPYIPLSPTSSFSRYAKNDFLEIDQYALAGVIRGLTARGVKVILSNSYTDETIRIFAEHLQMYVVDASRSISAKASSRGRVLEVIGLNFDAEESTNPEKIRTLTRAT